MFDNVFITTNQDTSFFSVCDVPGGLSSMYTLFHNLTISPSVLHFTIGVNTVPASSLAPSMGSEQVEEAKLLL